MTTTTDPIREDFRNFLYLVWEALDLPEPSPIQYDVASYLQEGPERLMVSALRGFGKSYETAALAAWFLYCNPDIKILCISAGSLRAREFIRLTRRIIGTLDICTHLRPGLWDIDGADRFDVGCLTKVTKDPSVAAYGIGSMITGTHVDVIIADDIETPGNSATVEARDKLYQQCLEFESILNPGGRIIYLGTPQTRESIYNKLSEHYELRRWPAEYPDLQNEDACKNVSPMLLEKLLHGDAQPGDPTFPERFTVEVLAEKKAIMGPSMYALQMLLDTTLADENRYPLKMRDLIVMPIHGDLAPSVVVWGTSNPINDIPMVGLSKDRFYAPIFYEKEFKPFQQTVMFIDPAGTGSDETGFCVARLLNGMVFVPEVGGLPGGHSDATLLKLAEIARSYGVKRVVVESNFGDGMYEKLLAPVLHQVNGPTSIESHRATGQKELRIIDTLEVVMANHRLVVDPRVARDQTLMSQLSNITRARGCLRHDDRIEALYGAVVQFSEALQVNPKETARQAKIAEIEAAAREFENSWSNTKNGRRVVVGSINDINATESSKRPRGKWGRIKWSNNAA